MQDYNGSVCVRIVDNGYNSLSDWTKLQFFNNNRLDATFNNVTKANKDARVQIVWKNNVVENCPLSNETNSTTSTDNFAIRPDKFSLILPSIGYAGKNFSVDFNADSAVDYNETLGSSFVVEANISKPSCFDGTLHVPLFSFENGQKNNVDVNYSEVGDINITIKEKLGSEFAYVDYDDTPDDVRLITRFSANMTILPHHFDINASFKNNYNDFTYLSTDLNMSAMLDINITAQNKQNIITKNYNNSCYAKDIDITIKHSTVGSTNLNDILYIYKDAKDINSSQNNIPKNNNISLLGYNKTNFTIDHNGTTEATFFINFDRDKNRPVNPFDFNITDINITDEDNIKGGISLDQNATFYYGKVRTEDLKTNEKSTPHSLNVEVYDNLGTLSFKQNSLNWYENEKDDYTNTITYQEKENFTFGDTKNGVTVNTVQNIAKGNIDFTITNTWTNSDSSMIHVDIPVWLWYSKYNNYDNTIDCSHHPCFEYRYINPEGTSSIQSGIFKGSSIGDDYNATKQKVGVKTFR